MQDKIYILYGWQGQYDDYLERNIKAFFNQNEATKFKLNLEAEIKKQLEIEDDWERKFPKIIPEDLIERMGFGNEPISFDIEELSI